MGCGDVGHARTGNRCGVAEADKKNQHGEEHGGQEADHERGHSVRIVFDAVLGHGRGIGEGGRPRGLLVSTVVFHDVDKNRIE